MDKMLKEICSLYGLSGFEYGASEWVKNELLKYTDKVYTDRVGNVTAVISGSEKNVLLDAHLDEIGGIVTGVKRGFVRFECVGGVDERMLPACEVEVGGHYGVITCLPPHTQSDEDMNKPMKKDDLYIDVGFDAQEKISIGTPIFYRKNAANMLNGCMTSKTIDDRGGIIAILRALEMLRGKENLPTITVVASVCEETTGVGIKVSNNVNAPDCAIIVDVSHANTPDSSGDDTGKFGGGVMIGIGPFINRKIKDKLVEIAKKQGIKHQLEVMSGRTGTNADSISGKTPCGVLSIPLKYMHTPVETVKLSDINDTASLIASFVAEV